MQISGLKNSERLSFLNLIILIGGSVHIIPFVFSFSTIDPLLIIRFIALSALTAMLMINIFIQNAKRRISADADVIYRAVFPIALVYLLAAGFSLFQTTNLSEGIFEWLKVFLTFTFFYAASLILTNNKDGVLFLTRSVIVTALMLGCIGICQYFQVAFTAIPGNYAIYATMANTNLFASALFLTLPFILFGAIRFSGFWRILSLITLTEILYAIAISESRAVWGAILIFTAGTVFLVLLHYQKLKLNQNEKYFYIRRSLVIMAIFCFSVLAAIWSHTIENNHLCLFLKKTRPAVLRNHGALQKPIKTIISLNGRFSLWQTSMRMIKAAPISGIGLGQWKIVAPAYELGQNIKPSNRGLRQTWVQRPHNDFLWVFSETGVFGILAYLLFWGVLIFYSLRIISGTCNIQKKIFVTFLLFGIIGFAVISFFSFPKERIFHNLFFMLISACIVSFYHQTFPIQKIVRRRKLFCFNFFLLGLLIFCWIFGHTRFEAEVQTKIALRAYKYEDWQRVISEIDKIDTRFYNLDPTSTPLAWYRGMANFSLGRIEAARKDFQRAYANNPYHVHVLNNLGTCYALQYDFDKAVDCYQRAIAISPQFEEAIHNLDGINFEMENYRKDRERLLWFSN
jgi:O-antigen ligase